MNRWNPLSPPSSRAERGHKTVAIHWHVTKDSVCIFDKYCHAHEWPSWNWRFRLGPSSTASFSWAYCTRRWTSPVCTRIWSASWRLPTRGWYATWIGATLGYLNPCFYTALFSLSSSSYFFIPRLYFFTCTNAAMRSKTLYRTPAPTRISGTGPDCFSPQYGRRKAPCGTGMTFRYATNAAVQPLISYIWHVKMQSMIVANALDGQRYPCPALVDDLCWNFLLLQEARGINEFGRIW